MSMLCKSSLQDYESLSLIIQTSHATMVVMSRDRFLLVRTMLHLNTNDIKAARGQTDYDLLFKIRPIIDALITQFQDVSTPDKQQTINEAICPYWSKESLTNME